MRRSNPDFETSGCNGTEYAFRTENGGLFLDFRAFSAMDSIANRNTAHNIKMCIYETKTFSPGVIAMPRALS